MQLCYWNAFLIKPGCPAGCLPVPRCGSDSIRNDENMTQSRTSCRCILGAAVKPLVGFSNNGRLARRKAIPLLSAYNSNSFRNNTLQLLMCRVSSRNGYDTFEILSIVAEFSEKYFISKVIINTSEHSLNIIVTFGRVKSPSRTYRAIVFLLYQWVPSFFPTSSDTDWQLCQSRKLSLRI